MHSHNKVCCAGAVQLPGKGKRRRHPHLAAAPVADDILRFFVPRLYHTGDKVPSVVHEGKRQRHRLIQNKGACGIVEHDPRLSPD